MKDTKIDKNILDVNDQHRKLLKLDKETLVKALIDLSYRRNKMDITRSNRDPEYLLHNQIEKLIARIKVLSFFSKFVGVNPSALTALKKKWQIN